MEAALYPCRPALFSPGKPSRRPGAGLRECASAPTNILTGDPAQKVANVEGLIADDAADVDVYHVNHHGSKTSSSVAFMQVIQPTVAIVSNGQSFCHPAGTVIKDRILAVSPKPDVYVTNRPSSCAWQAPAKAVADHNREKFDGIIEIGVWRKTYRVWRWRNGQRLDDPGVQYRIKQRN